MSIQPGTIDWKVAVGTGFNPEAAKKLLLIVGGETKSGKSAFAQTDPESFIFDFEAGTGYINARAMLFPAPGSNLKLTVPLFQEAYRAICSGAMAKSLGKPISRVVFDTWSSWYRLCDMYLTVEENRKRVQYNAKVPTGQYPKPILQSIGDMGQAGWNDLNDLALTPVWQLLDSGIGVTVLCHTEDKLRDLPGHSEKTPKQITETHYAMTPACSRALRRRAQFTARVLRSFDFDERNKSRSVVKLVFTSITSSGQAEAIDERVLGERIPIGEFVVPLDAGLLTFYERYNSRVAEIKAKIASETIQPQGVPK